MLIFDLREEVRLVSLLHLVAPMAIALGAVVVAPRSLRARLPTALAEAAKPLALVFAVTAAILGWIEFDKRRAADALAELCLSGGCAVAEGAVHGVEPVRQVSAGGRFSAPVFRGSFWVGEQWFSHYPRDYSDYSPANRLRDGEWVRVYTQDDRLVLVEVAD